MTRRQGTQDRRIQKTKSLLHEALVSLIREKDYDAIVVKEILDRANVGRSTFYTHFRDKDDLLVSGIHEMLGSVPSVPQLTAAKRHERNLWFSRPVFEHIDQHRRAGEAKMSARGRAIIHEHLQRVLGALISEEVKKSFQVRPKTVDPIPLDLVVRHIASTFILVLNWWVESKSPLRPREINDLFRALIGPTLAAACW